MVAVSAETFGHGTGKAAFAAQGKPGFPGGPVVPASEYERYARDVADVAMAQWLAAVTGLLGAVLVMATVPTVGRRVPRVLMLHEVPAERPLPEQAPTARPGIAEPTSASQLNSPTVSTVGTSRATTAEPPTRPWSSVHQCSRNLPGRENQKS